MNPTQFDAITRSLGTARSRRSMLKTLGATTLGALGLAGASRADAAPGGNSACAAFCQTVFPPGRQRGQCVRDAAHGTGTCVACGANPANYCTGTCTNVATDATNCGRCGTVCGGATDCLAPICTNGTCGTTATNEHGPCNGGAGTCQNGTCVATCLENNQTCAATTDTCCTPGYVCGDDLCGIGQTFACCGTTGAACTANCDCCGAVSCVGGICTPSNCPGGCGG